MTTTGHAFRHSRIPSAELRTTEYLEALRQACKQVEQLRKDGELPLARLVWRARKLYAECWRDEQTRMDRVR